MNTAMVLAMDKRRAKLMALAMDLRTNPYERISAFTKLVSEPHVPSSAPRTPVGAPATVTLNQDQFDRLSKLALRGADRAEAIREQHSEGGVSIRTLAKQYGASIGTVHKILQG